MRTAILQEALDSVVAGQPRTVFVHGEPGIGKTAVCEQFLAGALRTQTSVPRGAVLQPSAPSTYAAVLQSSDPAASPRSQ